MPRPSILNSIERKFILLVGDTIIIIASLNLFVNYTIDEQFLSNSLKIVVFLFGMLTYFIFSYVLDFYNLEKVAKRKYILSQAIYVSAIYVFLVFVFTVIVFDVSFWIKRLITFLLLTPIEIWLWRIFFRNIFRIVPITKNILYIYDENSKKDLKNAVDNINGNEIKTFYKVKLTHFVEDSMVMEKPLFSNASKKIDSLILNIKDYNSISKKLENLLLQSMLMGKEVLSYASFYENTYEALPIKSHYNSFYEILNLRNRKIRYLQVIFSFFVNFLLSLLVGVIFLLACPFVWFFNLFLNRGPLFYSQLRVGQHGKEFKIYKFRSMVVNAEQSGAKMATKNDTRITPFGKILRIFRIDELPQILSVIFGSMQFIGPRPERKIFVDQLNEITPFYSVRHLYKPGITGWAQVKYKYGEDLEDSIKKLEYDLYYIKNKSISLDLRIIFKTITTVLFSRGI